MYKLICVCIVMITINFVHAQDKTDSMRVGRMCKIIMHSGFEAEGTIDNRNSDTLWLKTEYSLLKIPIKDIKFVTEPGVVIGEIIEQEELTGKPYVPPPVKIDTS